jgi:ribosome-binding factor A
MESIRQQKVGSLLRKELAVVFQLKSRDWFGGRFITVTKVRVSPDLSTAKVYLSFMGSKDPESDLTAVQGQQYGLRKELAATLGKQLRKLPELSYYIDDSLDYYDEIDRLLKS